MKRPSIALSIFTLAGLSVAGLLIAADQDTKPPAGNGASPGPITPRTRTGPAPESVLDRRADIRVDKNMVLIPVAVTTQLGQYVTGLDKENFKLSENNVEQEIESFTAEDAPMSVGVVFDTSGSMGSKLQRSRQAVAEFM